MFGVCYHIEGRQKRIGFDCYTSYLFHSNGFLSCVLGVGWGIFSGVMCVFLFLSNCSVTGVQPYNMKDYCISEKRQQVPYMYQTKRTSGGIIWCLGDLHRGRGGCLVCVFLDPE